MRFGPTTVEFGVFGVDRHLMHPIFQWLDYRYKDYGAFARAVDERSLGGYRNRFTAGFNILNGTIDADQYVNTGGNKGAQLSSLVQRPQNYSLYAENSFYVLPSVALVAGTQYLHAVREQTVNFSANGDVPGRSSFDLWSPKVGRALGRRSDMAGVRQCLAQRRSAELRRKRRTELPQPELPDMPFFDIKPQTATTYEIGTRGRRPDYTWDVAFYRAEIKNELQCFFSSFGNCNVTNADRTVHQGDRARSRPEPAEGNCCARPASPTASGLMSPTPYNDFRYDNDATFGNNRPARRAAALHACGTAL